MVSAFLWLLLVECIAALALPIVVRVFSSFPDRGASFSKPISLLVISYIAWISASLHIVPLRFGVYVAVVILAAFSFASGTAMRSSLFSFFKEHRKEFLYTELAFILVFAAFAWIRSYNPAIEGQEKYMDFALLNTMRRASYLPPVDPWLSGYPVNYYYYGYFVWGLLIKISHIYPGVAYNLVLATIAAATCQCAYGVGYAIAKSRVTAFLAALFTGIVGNLDGALQIRNGAKLFAGLDYWRASRVVTGTINEFPFFSFIHGDVHPHVMALPFAILALALTVAMWSSAEGTPETQTSPLIWPLAVITLGSLFCMNAWDFPAYAGLFILSLAYSLWKKGEGEGVGRWALMTGSRVALIIFGAYLVFLPFHLNYEPPRYYEEGGLLGLVHAQTPLFKLLTIFGLFLFAIVSEIVLNLNDAYKQNAKARDLLFIGFAVLMVSLMVIQIPSAPWLSAQVFRNGATALGGGALLALVLTAWARRRDMLPCHWVLMAGGLFLLILCELVYIRDPYGDTFHRMNTVFKFYYQAWILLGIGAAVSIGSIISRFKALTVVSCPRRIGFTLWVIAGAGLILASMVYTIGATITRAGHFSQIPTLDGTAYLERDHRDDYEAIRWLNAHASDSDVVLEVTGDPYSYNARVSTNTGIATLLGWTNHEQVWRAGAYGIDQEIQRRKQAIEQIYAGTNVFEGKSIMERYQVRYVFVGELERARYSDEALAKFAGPLAEVYHSGRTAVYEIPRSAIRVP